MPAGRPRLPAPTIPGPPCRFCGHPHTRRKQKAPRLRWACLSCGKSFQDAVSIVTLSPALGPPNCGRCGRVKAANGHTPAGRQRYDCRFCRRKGGKS